VVSIKASAAVSHVGRIRPNNQDSGYVGQRLFLVADGMGGHAGGDVASALAAQRVSGADTEYESPAAARTALEMALLAANEEINDTVADHSELTGMGTTVSAALFTGNTMVIAHIGDSRLYLLRSNELRQISTDHTFVQRLVAAGRITADEAMTHPRRSVLMRVLGDVETSPDVDTMELEAREGDRWMICSDGLSGVVGFDELQEHMTSGLGAQSLAERLVKASLDGGAPDNVTVVIVDIGEPPAPLTPPRFVGSAATPITLSVSHDVIRSRRLIQTLTPFRPQPVQESHFEPDSREYLDELIEEDARRQRRRRRVWLVWVLLAAGVIAVASMLGYQWTQSRYYVGESNGRVAIYQGVQQDLGPITLSRLALETTTDVSSLSSYDRQRVEQTISADSLAGAQQIVQRLKASVE